MKKQHEETESSNEEETFNDYFQNPQKRKQFDNIKMYQQQKELSKMAGLNKQVIIEMPKKLKEKQTQRNYATVSLCCLTVTNPFREKVIRIVLNPWFDRIILLAIVVNSIFLALDDPQNMSKNYQYYADYVFLFIYTIEMCMKIIAMGFFMRPHSYLRDLWNVLDFFVVIMGWFGKIFTARNVSSIRVVRILRPLRTINSMPGMRELVQSLLASLPTLFDIFILFVFFYIMLGAIGVQLFIGQLKHRCYDGAGSIQYDNDNYETICDPLVDAITSVCNDGYACVVAWNPNYGITSFDNIFKAMLQIFIIMTLEGWTEIMYFVRKSQGTYIYDAYFVFIVVFGTYFILNLMIAVQTSYLNQTIEDQHRKKKEFREQILQQQLQASPKMKGMNQEGKQLVQTNQANNFEDAYNLAKQKENLDKDDLQNYVSNEQKVSDEEIIKEENKVEGKEKGYFIVRLQQFRKKVEVFVESKPFNIFIIVIILINSVFLSLVYYEMPTTLETILYDGNLFFTTFFALEMVIKIFGLGIKKYVKDGFNDFDAIIVVVGLLEFMKIQSKAVTVLRAFRLLRIFKIIRSWTSLKKLLQVVLKSLWPLGNLFLLMALFCFIYGLMGYQFFSGDMYNYYTNQARYVFTDFAQSMITIWILLTGENCNNQIYFGISQAGYGAAIFYVSNLILGNMMLLNMFLAIFLNFISTHLEEQDRAGLQNPVEEIDEIIEEELEYIREKLKANRENQYLMQSSIQVQSLQQQQQQQQQQQLDSPNKSFQSDLISKQSRIGDADQANSNENSNNVIQLQVLEQQQANNNNNNNNLKITEKSNEDGTNSEQVVTILAQKQEDIFENQVNEIKLGLMQRNKNQFQSDGDLKISRDQQSVQLKRTLRRRKKSSNSTTLNLSGRSLFILNENSTIRLILKDIIEHPYFEGFIYHIIGLNCLLLAFSEPVLSDTYQKKSIDLMSTVITGIFIAEATVKIVVLGFLFGKQTYLKDPFNVLDFIIVFFSILSMILNAIKNISISYVKGFRALRALRPLRMVSKNEGMKNVVNSLLISIPGLLNVLLICLLFQVVFGILFVQLFQGAMSYCNDSLIPNKQLCTDTFFNSVSGSIEDREWVTPFNNFNNILHATITFFEVSTEESWPDVMYATIDSVDVDLSPVVNNRPLISLLFVGYLSITTFFIMNLFDTVIVDKFSEEIKKREGSHNFTEEQKEWVKMQRIMITVNPKLKPIVPTNLIRKLCFQIVQNAKFEIFIIGIIGCNTVILVIPYDGAPDSFNYILNQLNTTFVIVFTLEALLKLLGHGFRYYWHENWNKFDIIIVIVSLVSLDSNLTSLNFTALRIIRVARLLRMIKASKGLRDLLKTLYLALENIGNVAALLFLIYFTFTVAGMDIYGDMPFKDNINQNANFTTFYLTFMLLLRASTGENWNYIMIDCYKSTGIIAIVYWVMFVIITTFVFLNIFVAVIYEAFNDIKSSNDANEVLSLKLKDIKSFISTWAQFNQNGEHYMKTSLFKAFLQELPPPLGYEGIKIESSKLNKIIFCLNIRDHQGRVYFPEVMWAIFHSIIGNNDEKVHKCEQVQNIMKIVKRKYKGLGKNVTPDSLCGNKFYKNEMTVSKYLCAMQIVQNWRKLKERRTAAKRAAEQQWLDNPEGGPVQTEEEIKKEDKDNIDEADEDKEVLPQKYNNKEQEIVPSGQFLQVKQYKKLIVEEESESYCIKDGYQSIENNSSKRNKINKEDEEEKVRSNSDENEDCVNEMQLSQLSELVSPMIGEENLSHLHQSSRNKINDISRQKGKRKSSSFSANSNKDSLNNLEDERKKSEADDFDLTYNSQDEKVKSIYSFQRIDNYGQLKL